MDLVKNIYLDIDGVLLTKQGASAPHLVEFLDFVTSNFNYLSSILKNTQNIENEFIFPSSLIQIQEYFNLNKALVDAEKRYKNLALTQGFNNEQTKIALKEATSIRAVLNKVDLPTFGKPTMPMLNFILLKYKKMAYNAIH